MSHRVASAGVGCLQLAWANSAQHPARTLTALLGTALAIFLLLLQLEFLNAVRDKAVALYDLFDFDLAVVSRFYQLVYGAPPFDAVRLAQVRVDPAVADVFALNIRITDWESAETGAGSSLILIGVDDKPGFVRHPAVRRALSALREPGTVLVDGFAHDDYGSLVDGSKARIGDREQTVIGRFPLGLFFYADGSAIVANTHFPGLANRDRRNTSVGLVRLAAGADPAAAGARLAAALPDDVLVYTRAALIDQEQRYFVSVKPAGVMLYAGMVIAFVVGAVILYQVLATEVSLRMGEYATMKAMGFGPGFIYGVAMVQGAMYAVVGFVIAAAAARVAFAEIRNLVPLPMALDAPLAGTVLAAAVAMCATAGYLALRRLKRADPAALF